MKHIASLLLLILSLSCSKETPLFNGNEISVGVINQEENTFMDGFGYSISSEAPFGFNKKSERNGSVKNGAVSFEYCGDLGRISTLTIHQNMIKGHFAEPGNSVIMNNEDDIYIFYFIPEE